MLGSCSREYGWEMRKVCIAIMSKGDKDPAGTIVLGSRGSWERWERHTPFTV